jgi:hypothetical protein
MKSSITATLTVALLLTSACSEDSATDADDGPAADRSEAGPTSDGQREHAAGKAGAGHAGELAEVRMSMGTGSAVRQSKASAGAPAADTAGVGGDSAAIGGARAAAGGRSGTTDPNQTGSPAGGASGGSSGSAAMGGDANATKTMPADSDMVVSVAFTLNKTGEPVPVVLFDGGYATYDASIVTQSPIDAAAHRKANPDSWTQWRRISGQVELKTSSGWQQLSTHDEAKPLPKATPLSQLHGRYYSPDPNGNPLIYITWRYRFNENGTFEYCKVSVVVGTNPDLLSRERDMRAGRYHVDGYTLRLDDDKGVSDTHAFFYEGPTSERMWIDGLYYSLADADDELCSS